MRSKGAHVALWFIVLLVFQSHALILRRNPRHVSFTAPADTVSLLEVARTTSDEECLTHAETAALIEEQLESSAGVEIIEAVQAIATEQVVEAVTEVAIEQEVSEAIEDVVPTEDVSEAVAEETGEEVTSEQIIAAVEEATGAETVEEAIEIIEDMTPEEVIETVTTAVEEGTLEEASEDSDHDEECLTEEETAALVEEQIESSVVEEVIAEVEAAATQTVIEAVTETVTEEQVDRECLTREQVAEVLESEIENNTVEAAIDAIQEIATAEVVEALVGVVEEERGELPEESEHTEVSAEEVVVVEAIEEVVSTEEVVDAVAEETGIEVSTEDIIAAVEEATEASSPEEAAEIASGLTSEEIIEIVTEAAVEEHEEEEAPEREVTEEEGGYEAEGEEVETYDDEDVDHSDHEHHDDHEDHSDHEHHDDHSDYEDHEDHEHHDYHGDYEDHEHHDHHSDHSDHPSAEQIIEAVKEHTGVATDEEAYDIASTMTCSEIVDVINEPAPHPHPQPEPEPEPEPQPPTAIFTWEVTGNTVTIDASGSTGTCSWDFGDGSTGTGTSVTHEYSGAGTYTVTLTVTDTTTGKTTTQTHTITIEEIPVIHPPVVATFTIAVSGDTVAADASSSGGDIESCSWDFGDGASGNGYSVSHQYSESGTYTVTLTVTDVTGATSTKTETIKILPPLVSTFTFEVSGDTVTCDASGSGGDIVSYEWNFGEEGGFGNTATGSTVTHQYTTPGEYTITLIITDSAGSSSTKTQTLTILPPLISTFSVTITGDTVSCDASGSSGAITNYEWNFGDEASSDNTATGTSVSHKYSTAGTYTLTLILTDSSGATSSNTQTIRILPALTASFSIAVSGDTVRCDASGSGGEIESYVWDFGDTNDGTNNIGSGTTVTHQYSTPGTYTVTLTLTDTAGSTSTKSQTIRILPALEGSFSYTLNRDTIVCDASRSGGEIASYDWNFGDGSKGTGATVTHKYTESGTYTITLTLTDTAGSEDTKTQTIRILPPLVPSISFQVSGDTVSCDASASGGEIEKYEWDFGDGSSGNGATVTHQYTQTGSYTITLTIIDTAGDSTTKTQDIRILPPLIASISFQIEGSTVTCDASGSSGEIESYEWDFGDSGDNTASGASVTHQYAESGDYTITLTLTDTAGTTTTSVQNIRILPPIVPSIEYEVDLKKVSVDASGSGGEIASFEWDFGDANSAGSTATGATASHEYSAPGTYIITLTLTDTAGTTNTGTQTVRILPDVVASFEFRVELDTVYVDASGSGGEVDSYEWDFGDKFDEDHNTDTGATASHQYTQPGSYTITLTITDVAGTTNTKEETIRILPAVVPSFTFQVNGNTVKCDASGSSGELESYAWDFGDTNGESNTATGTTASHTYSRSGTYTITLTVTDSAGTSNTKSHTIRILPALVPSFTYEISGNTVHCDASQSGGEIASYEWDFGESGSAKNTDTGSTVSHQYGAAGTYTIKLTVTDTAGTVNVKEHTIRILPPVVATFTAQVSGHTVGCDASQSGGEIASYEWDFGDGSKGTGASVSHQYSTPGTYTITCTITDIAGTKSTKTQTIRILPTLVGHITYSVNNYFDVSVDASQSGGEIAKYAWDFGEAGSASNIATGAKVTHTYSRAGSYTITLTLTDTAGTVITKTETIRLIPRLAPAFTTSLSGNTVSCDASTSGGEISSYVWDFGDSNSASNIASGAQATHTYSAAGRYTITLTLTDTSGKTQTKTDTVKILPPLVASFTSSVSGKTVSFDASGSTGDITSYAWDFGEAGSSSNRGTGSRVSHTYAVAGTYTITLTLTDSAGTTNTKQESLRVIPELTAGFTYSVSDFTVSVDASASSGDITRYTWNFGEAASSSNTALGATATHTYASRGSFTITLTVTDSTGAYQIRTETIAVKGALVADFTVQLFGDTVDCDASMSGGNIVRYDWDFGDTRNPNDNYSGEKVSHKYARVGTYTITLTVTDTQGRTSTKTASVQPFVSLGAGKLQFTIIWDRPGDVDMYVKTPTGRTISWRNTGPSPNTDNGQLDVDDRTGKGPENIFWADRFEPPSGTYYVCVDTMYYYSSLSSSRPVTATVSIRRPDGAPIILKKEITSRIDGQNCRPGIPGFIGSYDYVA